MRDNPKTGHSGYCECNESMAYESIPDDTPKPDLIKLAKDITCKKDETVWKDVQSYSHRQRRLTPVSGITGCITFSGNLEPFRELLTWGELIHVGKSAVKGNGWYKIAM